MRQYPSIPLDNSVEPPPLTVVTVRFSEEFEHNINRSLAALDRRHQTVVVDNLHGLRFATLGQALMDGLRQAEHDLVALVHEDVLLPAGFLGRLGHSLRILEDTDPEWGLAGSVGWDHRGRSVGHWSDPHRYRNTLAYRTIAQVDRLDEQLMLFRRSRGLQPDPRLPSIHGIGWDLALQARARRRATYAIDAPTIHKFADAGGLPIERADDSPKIVHRSSQTFAADKAVADEYLRIKWGLDLGGRRIEDRPRVQALDKPVVLLGRGGSGTRLLSAIADELGVFIGSERNPSGDSMEMVPAIYRTLFRTMQVYDDVAGRSPEDLVAAAGNMLELAAPSGLWGFKVPESMLVVESIIKAFPNARVLHLIRDPLATCLRRPHMTARVDNEIGRACLRSAYRSAGIDMAEAVADPPCVRMAITTNHQIGKVLALCDSGRLDGRYLDLLFEDLVNKPAWAVARVARWLGASVERPGVVEALVDRHRSATPAIDISAPEVQRVRQIVSPLRVRLGYGAT